MPQGEHDSDSYQAVLQELPLSSIVMQLILVLFQLYCYSYAFSSSPEHSFRDQSSRAAASEHGLFPGAFPSLACFL